MVEVYHGILPIGTDANFLIRPYSCHRGFRSSRPSKILPLVWRSLTLTCGRNLLLGKRIYIPPEKRMFGLAVQPPAQAKPSVALYPPIVARLSSETSIFQELSQIWAVASLISPSGEILHEKLAGRVADSAHPIAENVHSRSEGGMKDRAYFYFPDLVIHKPGQYCVRVTLMRMSYSHDSAPQGDVRFDEYVDSHSIMVEDGASNPSRPSKYSTPCDYLTLRYQPLESVLS